MEIVICGKRETWTAEKLEAERERRRQWSAAHPDADSLYNFDEGWLSQWARSATDHMHTLIGQILEQPEGVALEPWHCGQVMRFIEWPYSPMNRQYGSFWTCKVCDYKLNDLKVSKLILHVRDGEPLRLRRDPREDGLVLGELTYRRGIQMNNAGIYYICRTSEADRPSPTAAEVLGATR